MDEKEIDKLLSVATKIAIHSDYLANPRIQPDLNRDLDTLCIGIKKMANEIARLKKLIEGLADRIAAQSELLSKKAEQPSNES